MRILLASWQSRRVVISNHDYALRPLPRSAAPRLVFVSCLLAFAFAFALASLAFAAEPARKPFDIPRGDALATLKQFSTQAGTRLLYSVDSVHGVKTNPVKGAYTPREALVRLVANTGLIVTEAEANGALAVSRKDPPVPNGDWAAGKASTRPTRTEASTAGPLPAGLLPGLGAIEGMISRRPPWRIPRKGPPHGRGHRIGDPDRTRPAAIGSPMSRRARCG